MKTCTVYLCPIVLEISIQLLTEQIICDPSFVIYRLFLTSISNLSNPISYRVPSASSPTLAFGSRINSRFSKSLADEISTLSFIDAAANANSNAASLDEARLAAQEVGGGSTGNIPVATAGKAAMSRSSTSASGLSLSLSSDESVCQMALRRKRELEKPIYHLIFGLQKQQREKASTIPYPN